MNKRKNNINMEMGQIKYQANYKTQSESVCFKIIYYINCYGTPGIRFSKQKHNNSTICVLRKLVLNLCHVTLVFKEILLEISIIREIRTTGGNKKVF